MADPTPFGTQAPLLAQGADRLTQWQDGAWDQGKAPLGLARASEAWWRLARAVWPAAPKPERARAALERLDHEVLQAFWERGYLETLPMIHHVDRSPGGSSTTVSLADGGHVFLHSDARGELLDRVGPGEGAADLAMFRWQILLHEAAHGAFERLRVPFRPTSGRLTEGCVETLNTWVFSPLVDHGPWRAVLNESFADVYAGMLLLEGTHHAPEAVALLERYTADRRATRERLEALQTREGVAVSAATATGSPVGAFLGVHHTDFALERLLATRPAWQGLPPEALQAHAVRCASDGWLDWTDPARLDAEGGRPGLTARQGLTTVRPAAAPGFLLMMGLHERGHDAEAVMGDRMGQHPMWPVLHHAWTQARPEVERRYGVGVDRWERTHDARFQLERMECARQSMETATVPERVLEAARSAESTLEQAFSTAPRLNLIGWRAQREGADFESAPSSLRLPRPGR